ncbi:unnamed protein product [Tilletia controversa]|uniref:UspA domain-containing protein n=3 Tax=Tilletia TaxID=13289 RepID=A0A8X7SWL0_9BASI|nr:hypothetical protein CF336_g5100 [Tilletia laevis]KAE8198265.1 hypothetical protein CF328_g3601 [Tilletia controversa]KAE8260306.1 hypothetical protein A4X03_0g3853 [Tilletia caries]KAE8207276.1 hypothetical protein CF335_g1260 [Tilletia laevis]KAE8247590.1 hypothetical protein A4X06_0g4338 [Tilletia controversa]
MSQLKSALRRPQHPNSPPLESTPAAAGAPGAPQHAGLVGSSAYGELQSSIDSTTSARSSASASPAPTPALPSPALSTTSSTFSAVSNLAPAPGAAGAKDGYLRRVAFDTMPDAASTSSHDFSFTLQVRSQGYRRTRHTRTFMCAVDGNSYSTHALEWLLDHLVEDGDEVVALRVLDAAHAASDSSDSDDERDEAQYEKKLIEYREEAKELVRSIEDLNDDMGDRRISIVVEFVSADPHRRTLTTSITSTVVRLIHMYRPDSITIGTRGKNATLMQKMMMGAGFSNSVVVGSVSREILSRSPVPVIVVRPENKVEKHLKKRQADPKRRSYHDLMANALHGHIHSHSRSGSSASTSSAPSPTKQHPSGGGGASAGVGAGVATASPLKASFGPDSNSSQTASSSTSSSSSSLSSSNHPAEETPSSSNKTSSSTSSAASEIAKRKPSLRVLEREQHPAGAECLSPVVAAAGAMVSSPTSATTPTAKSSSLPAIDERAQREKS